jgi:hypothetical protein
MRVFGMDDVTLTASTVINRQVRQMELALVLDNTGSMLGSPFTAMQSAAKELVEIVYGDHETHANLYVAVVPFVAAVNVGPAHTAWLAAGDPAIMGAAYKPSAWKGCVMARTTGKGDTHDFDQTDDPPAVRAFQGYLYPDASDNDWGAPRSPPVREQLTAYNDGYGPNLGCGPPILPLTASRTAVLAALDGMGPWHRGGTAGNEGVAWGWRVLLPRWRGLWGGATPGSRPLDDDVADNDKVVVMLTDGNNNVYDHPPAGPRGSDHTSMGRLADFMHSGAATAAQGKAEWDNRMLNVCGRMKARGVIVYTITFGSTPSSSTKTLYRTCATKQALYFHSPTNGELRTIFRTIGMQLSNRRISRRGAPAPMLPPLPSHAAARAPPQWSSRSSCRRWHCSCSPRSSSRSTCSSAASWNRPSSRPPVSGSPGSANQARRARTRSGRSSRHGPTGWST